MLLSMTPRIELSKEVKEFLFDHTSMPRTIEVHGSTYTLHKPIAAGYKGVVWEVTDDFARRRAAKIAIAEDYQNRSFLQELALTAKLEPYSQFAKFDVAGVIKISIGGEDQTFVCFIEEWIDGYTLKDFLLKEHSSVTSSFLIEYVKEMCTALSAFRVQNLRHDDLHSGNVMLGKAAPGMPKDKWSVKIIDTGSLKVLDNPTKKLKDDHQHFVEHIVQIYNTIQRKKLLPVRERRFLDECFTLIQSMLDDDASIALTAPDQIRTSFELAHTRVNAPRTITTTLQSPFEYISAEHIADDRLLVDIFAESCPWLEKVAGPDPCLVAGPRGCGKSTMFRWLSLKAHLHNAKPDFDRFRIAGFYISCSSGLQNRFGWIKTAMLASKFQNEIVHYFNLMLVREVVQTLCMICDRQDRETYWGLGDAQEQKIYNFLFNSFQTHQPTLQGVSRLRQLLEMLEANLFDCHIQMLKGENLQWTTPETLLGDLTTILSAEIPFFAQKRIAFLLDDFSSHRLPEPVQIILNRIIWERRDSHIFKLSSEKYGAALTDSFHATVDVNREMIEIDCGREYVSLDDTNQQEAARKFATDLLSNRLAVAGYTGTPENLLGVSEWDKGTLGRALREKQPGRKNDQYHGIECIANLCSGDISTLLLVYRRIFERGNVTKDTITQIAKHTQHDAIESVSRELFEGIRNHYPHGKEMHSIVREFGSLVQRILREGKSIKQGNQQIPPQCPRIEVDQDFKNADDELSPAQLELARELVRRAVFIEMEPGRSRHKSLTTLRWQLRRVYLPVFGAALSKNDAIKWRPENFKWFLIDPAGACEAEWQKRPREKDVSPQSSFDMAD